MTKPPKTQAPAWGRGWRPLAERGARHQAPPGLVAEALTEEEAAAELASRRAEQERLEAARREAEAAKVARREEKQAQKAERRTQKAEERIRRAEEKARLAALKRQATEAKPEQPEKSPHVRPLRVSRGRLQISLNTTTLMVAGAAICAVGLLGYSFGTQKRGKHQAGSLPAAAAITLKEGSAESSPLLPNSSRGAASTDSGDPLAVLFQPPQPKSAKPAPRLEVQGGVRANAPARIDGEARTAVAATQDLNFLAIQSFGVTKYTSNEAVVRELAEVQTFLAAKGVPTLARKVGPNRFILYSKQGYPPGVAYESARTALQRQVEQFGQEFSKQGGKYVFNGCFWVSYAKAHEGEPAGF